MHRNSPLVYPPICLPLSILPYAEWQSVIYVIGLFHAAAHVFGPIRPSTGRPF